MQDIMLVNTPLTSYFRLSKEQSPTIEAEHTHMDMTPNASTVGSLIYVMVYTRPESCEQVYE